MLIVAHASSGAVARWQTIFAQSVSGEKVAVFIGWFYLALFLDYSNNEKNMKTSIKRNNLEDR
jgi:biotin transporter BioY